MAEPGETPQEANTRRNEVRALMARFVRGAGIRPHHHMTWLGGVSDPAFANLFEMRFVAPLGATRLIGYFARPAVFVGLCLKLRSELGEMGDPGWLLAAQDARQKWVRLFGQALPYKGKTPVDTRSQIESWTDE